MKLTDAKLRTLTQPGRYFDGGGLYLEVTAAGGRYWRAKYRAGGKEKRLAFGVYAKLLGHERRDVFDTIKLKADLRSDPIFPEIGVGHLPSDDATVVANQWFGCERHKRILNLQGLVSQQDKRLLPQVHPRTCLRKRHQWMNKKRCVQLSRQHMAVQGDAGPGLDLDLDLRVLLYPSLEHIRNDSRHRRRSRAQTQGPRWQPCLGRCRSEILHLSQHVTGPIHDSCARYCGSHRAT